MNTPGIETLAERRLTRRVPARHRQVIKVAVDAAMLASVFFVAYALRFDFEIPSEYYLALRTQLPLVVVVQLVILWLAGTRRIFWRYFSLADLPPFLKATGYWVLVLLVPRMFLGPSLQEYRVPLSVILLDTILAFGGA